MNTGTRNRALTALSFALALGAVGCKASSSSNGSNSSASTLRANLGLEFSAIKGFVIAPPGAVSASPGALGASSLRADQGAGSVPTTTEVLYAISASGTLSIVQVTVQGSETSAVEPLAIYDTALFTLFRYSGVTIGGMTCSLIAVRKSDSALFCIDATPNTSPCGSYTPASYAPVGSDSTGGLIYVNTVGNGADFPGGLVLLNFSAAVTATVARITDDSTDGTLCDMALNRDGDVLTVLRSSGNADTTRLYRAGGGFVNVSASESDCLTGGPGIESEDFYFLTRSTTSVNFVLHKLTKGGTGFADSIVFDDSAGSVGLKDCRYGSIVKSATAVFMSYGPSNGAPGLWDSFVELPSGSVPTAITVPLFNEVDKLFADDAGLVVEGKDSLGNGGLARFATATASFSTVLAPGDYSLTAVGVSSAGGITFGGRRASDNARVLGTVPAGSSTVTIDSSTLPGDVQQILRID